MSVKIRFKHCQRMNIESKFLNENERIRNNKNNFVNFNQATLANMTVYLRFTLFFSDN